MSTASEAAPAPPRAAPARGSELLSGVDNAWLRMDEPANLMQINGVLVLEERVEVEAIKAIVRQRLLPIPRFRQLVVAGEGERPRWQDDPGFDLDRHVLEERLADPGDDEALAALIGRLMSTPLDPGRPLWEFRLIQSYRSGCVLFGCIHHVIGDGVALMLVLLALTDLAPRGSATVRPRPDVPNDAQPGEPGEPAHNPFTDLFAHPARDLAKIRALAHEIMPEAMRLLLDPAEAFRRARLLTGVAGVGAFGRLVGRWPDPRTAFKGPLVVPKLVAWSERLPLAEVKEVGRVLGGTVNDVLVAAVSGGLRRYLARQAEPPPGLNIRVAMPVNLRPLGRMAELGNHFGLIFLSLPLGIADPLARLAEVRRRAGALKRSTEPLVVYGILRALGRVPLAVQRLVVKIFATKATAVMTNVPGPRQTLYLAGKAIGDIFFWVPQSGRVGLGVSICSYRGSVRLGVSTDAGLLPDPAAIVEGFHADFAELLSLARGRAA
ncbi:MAG TPA: wax ester/triacylglycerol synthase family O-acyltransferase [Thermoanaerobaculia bacterium]|nr:wax ester/triacylglycerol synthase family O-acyltransferase [Thermoanaerobaculia bacterium]